MSIATEGMPNPTFGFGDRIRKVRRDIAHMTQAEMADVLGVTQKAYAAWESGGKPGDIVGIARLVEQLWPGRVTAAWVMGVDGSEPPPRPPAQPFHKPQAARRARRLRPVTDVVEDRSLELVEVTEDAEWYVRAIAGDVAGDDSSQDGKPVDYMGRLCTPANFVTPNLLTRLKTAA